MKIKNINEMRFDCYCDTLLCIADIMDIIGKAKEIPDPLVLHYLQSTEENMLSVARQLEYGNGELI